jgi:hypothetical protein
MGKIFFKILYTWGGNVTFSLDGTIFRMLKRYLNILTGITKMLS